MIPCILLSVGAGLGLAWSQKPTYTAYASYALVFQGRTTSTNDPRSLNPLTPNDAALLGESLVSDLMSGTTQETMGKPGTSGTAPSAAVDGTHYAVTLPQYSQSYLVQTWSKDSQVARSVVDAVVASTPLKAGQIQTRAGAPPRSQYTTFVTAPTQVNELPPTSTVKLLIAVIAVGLLVGAALSIVIDRLITRQNSATDDDRAAWEDEKEPAWGDAEDLDGDEADSDLGKGAESPDRKTPVDAPIPTHAVTASSVEVNGTSRSGVQDVSHSGQRVR